MDQAAQEELYRTFYGYAMGICLRYTQSKEEAQEVVNDGFIKLFQHIKHCKKEATFKGWLRRIMINASIDYYRQHQKHHFHLDISHSNQQTIQAEGLTQLTQEEVIQVIQQLSPAYRLIFNLYAIEGFTHKEIAAKLDISIGTSKSNLAKARIKLKKMLEHIGQNL